jgi:hypothetical protein
MRMIFLAAALLASSLPSAPVFAETPEETAADCETRMGLGPGGCKCIVDDWAKFNEKQRVFLGAFTSGDKPAAQAAEAELNEREKGHVGYFIATISSAFRC